MLPKIISFDIILVKSKGFVPSVIRFFTRSKWNHCAIVVDGIVYEAIKSGFKATNTVDEYLKNRTYAILRLKTPLKISESINMRMRLKILEGKKYEFINLAFFQIIKSVTGKWIGTTNINRVICSESVAFIYKPYFKKYYSVTPHEISINENFEYVTENSH